MKQGCKYCQYNRYDGVNLGSNTCSVYADHIDPYSEGYCDKFKDEYSNLIVFDGQLESPEIHND